MCCPFLHGCVFMMIEEMDVWYLSALFVWPQFVLAKGENCWVFVLASLLLKQISMFDVGNNVPT